MEKENVSKLENLLEEIKSNHEVEKKKLSEEIHENLNQQHNLTLQQLRFEFPFSGTFYCDLVFFRRVSFN